MESYNSHTSYSCSSSNYSSYPRDNDDQIGRSKPVPVPSFLSSLHSVRKPILMPKPMLKKPIAPLPPTRPRVYKVDSSDFKQVVQKLTSEFQNSASHRRLQDVAPPPLNISSSPKFIKPSADIDAPPPPPPFPSPLAAIFRDLLDENIFDSKPLEGVGDDHEQMSSVGFSLKPNFNSFLNETLDSDSCTKPTKSWESWGEALLSPLGFSLTPKTVTGNTKLATSKLPVDCFGALSPLGFSLSPSSAAWCSMALASPPMGETTVL